MRIYLDLLPDSRKEEIKKKKFFKILLGQETRILVPFIFFIAVLVSINFSLKIQLDTLEKADSEDSSQKKYQELRDYEKKFSEINAKARSVSSYQANHIYWSSVINEVTGLFPDRINLTSLVTENYTLSLAGKAKNRDDLLTFQDKLKTSQCFKNVDVPLSNLISKEDVIFKIDIDINKACLKR